MNWISRNFCKNLPFQILFARAAESSLNWQPCFTRINIFTNFTSRLIISIVRCSIPHPARRSILISIPSIQSPFQANNVANFWVFLPVPFLYEVFGIRWFVLIVLPHWHSREICCTKSEKSKASGWQEPDWATKKPKNASTVFSTFTFLNVPNYIWKFVKPSKNPDFPIIWTFSTPSVNFPYDLESFQTIWQVSWQSGNLWHVF